MDAIPEFALDKARWGNRCESMAPTIGGFRGFLVVESKVCFAVCGIGAVAMEAVLREDWANLEPKIDGAFRVGVGCR